MKHFFSVSIITLVLSCTGPNKSVENPEYFLSGNNWNLTRIYLPAGSIEVAANIANLKFDAEKKSAGGKGGCNNYGAKYAVTNDDLNFKDLFSTKMFCEQHQEVENNFFKNLEKVTRYDVKENRLYLYAGTELLLEFGK